jgi:hypothetical protein
LVKWESSNAEWTLNTDASDLIRLICWKSDASAYVGRYYNTAITADEGSWHTYIGTANGGSPQAVGGLKVYRDGVQIDDTNLTGGVYGGMTNGTQPPSDFLGGGSGPYAKAKYGVAMIINKELTAEEVRRLDWILRSYAGVDI